jgi:hypothetical protein
MVEKGVGPMRLGTLHYDMRKEEGVVRLEGLPPDVVSLDTLQDWIGQLTDEYNRMLEEVFPKEN